MIENNFDLPQDKLFKEFKRYLEIVPSCEKTYVIIVAKNKINSSNTLTRINCKRGLPIGGYMYDSQSDSYYIECEDYLSLGHVPISFFGKIKNLNNWTTRIPIPENILKKYLTNLQQKELNNFCHKFSSQNYEIHYMQMIDPN
jgi:hypothetical protein